MKEGQSESAESKREYGGGIRHRNFNYAIPYNYIIYLETSIFAFSIVLAVEIAGRGSFRVSFRTRVSLEK